MLAESSSGFPSQCKTQFGKGFSAPRGAPGRHFGQFRQSFGKNFSRAGFVFTKETADHYQEPQGFSCAGQVRECTSVATVNTMGNLLAKWASSFNWFYRQG